jgi:methyl-accepting chemotaxis protein
MHAHLRLPALAVRTRLIVGVAALLALLAASLVVSYALLGRIDSSRTKLTSRTAPYFAALSDAAVSAKGVANDERGYLLTGDSTFLDEISKRVAKVHASIAQADKVYPTGSQEERLAAHITSGFDAWLAAIQSEFTLYKTDAKTATDNALGPNRDLRKAYEALFDQAHDVSAADLAQADRSLHGSVSSARTTLLVTFLLALAVGLGVAFWITLGLRRGLGEVLSRLRSLNENCLTALNAGLAAMAQGDLTVEAVPVTTKIESHGSDEIGQVAHTVNGLIEKTQGSLRGYNETRAKLGATIEEVSRTALEVGSASQQMATTSEEAGKAVGEVAHAIGDVSQGAERQVRMVEAAKRSTHETAEKASEACKVAEEGVEAAQFASDAMRAVRDSSVAVTEVIRKLADKSDQIGGIVDTITGIAGQTNLLALNAAIEAARAGDQGRGFAVVAEEVRKLAEESQRAAQTIAGLIQQIQTETAKAVEVVEDGAKRTDEGAAVVDEARAAFATIGGAVREIHERIEQISAATSEIAVVAEQSSSSTEQVSASTEETSASTQEIAASAQDLARSAEELERLIGQFKVAG